MIIVDNITAAKIGVIGDNDTIICFKAFGMDIFPASELEPEVNRRKINELARDRYGVIFVTERIAQTITDTIERYNNSPLPAIILIPSIQGSLGIGLKRIRENVEKAVGLDILDT